MRYVPRKHELTIARRIAVEEQRAAARCTVGARRAAKCKQVSKAEGQGAAGYWNGAKNDGSSCMPENPLGLSAEMKNVDRRRETGRRREREREKNPAGGTAKRRYQRS